MFNVCSKHGNGHMAPLSVIKSSAFAHSDWDVFACMIKSAVRAGCLRTLTYKGIQWIVIERPQSGSKPRPRRRLQPRHKGSSELGASGESRTESERPHRIFAGRLASSKRTKCMYGLPAVRHV